MYWNQRQILQKLQIDLYPLKKEWLSYLQKSTWKFSPLPNFYN